MRKNFNNFQIIAPYNFFTALRRRRITEVNISEYFRLNLFNYEEYKFFEQNV